MPGHPVWLTQGIDGVAIEVGQCFTVHLVRSTTVVFKIARQCHGIRTRLSQRLADIHCLKPCQLLDML